MGRSNKNFNKYGCAVLFEHRALSWKENSQKLCLKFLVVSCIGQEFYWWSFGLYTTLQILSKLMKTRTCNIRFCLWEEKTLRSKVCMIIDSRCENFNSRLCFSQFKEQWPNIFNIKSFSSTLLNNMSWNLFTLQSRSSKFTSQVYYVFGHGVLRTRVSTNAVNNYLMMWTIFEIPSK